MKKGMWLLLLVAFTLLLGGCLSEKGSPLPGEQAPQRTALEQNDPKAVAEAFIRAQANNDRALMHQLMTPELQQSFAKRDLYLFDRNELKDKKVILNNIKVTEENKDEDSALYNVEYELNIEEDGFNEQKQVIDLVFVAKNREDRKWYVTTYQHVLMQ
ncbi:MAG: DUF4878 domain-containing protein [Thermoanaerobacteraceae bacterium]|nr:DUF4878 domain-containing protein [Thermoanaerobacteraceae bacterium]